jgi:hypothetical protein
MKWSANDASSSDNDSRFLKPDRGFNLDQSSGGVMEIT